MRLSFLWFPKSASLLLRAVRPNYAAATYRLLTKHIQWQFGTGPGLHPTSKQNYCDTG